MATHRTIAEWHEIFEEAKVQAALKQAALKESDPHGITDLAYQHSNDLIPFVPQTVYARPKAEPLAPAHHHAVARRKLDLE